MNAVVASEGVGLFFYPDFYTTFDPVGEELGLRHNPFNVYDANAIELWTTIDEDGGDEPKQVGFLPRALAALLAPLVRVNPAFRMHAVISGPVISPPKRCPLEVHMTFPTEMAAQVSATPLKGPQVNPLWAAGA